MPTKNEEISARIATLLKDKKLGLELGSNVDLLPVFISTSIPQLDEIMGGGVPVNKFTMFYGESSHGKTFLSQLIAASFQSQNKLVALLDAEQSYDPRWWATTKVDVDNLLVQQPVSGEDAVMKVEALIGKVELIIVDSLADFVPLSETELDITKKATMGRQAQLISTFYRKCLSKIKNSNTSIITINQVRDNFSNPYVVNLPGGRAQRFASHIMLEIARESWIKNSDGAKTGFMMRIRNTKNKLGTPEREISLPISFEGKFDYVTLLVSDGIDRGLIVNSGAYYRIPGELVIDTIPDGYRYKVMEDTGQHQIMGREGLHKLLEVNEHAMKVLELMVYEEKN